MLVPVTISIMQKKFIIRNKIKLGELFCLSYGKFQMSLSLYPVTNSQELYIANVIWLKGKGNEGS